MKKIAIVGSRNFDERDAIFEFMRTLHDVEIVSGGAKGVDTIAEEIAKEMGLSTKIFKPDFSRGYHVSAYHERNKQIVDYADEVHIFWHQPTRGSMSTLSFAKELNKPYFIHEMGGKNG